MASPRILRRARERAVGLVGQALTRRRRLYGRDFLVPAVLPGVQGVLQSEDWLQPLLARLMAARPGVVLDVGANLGQTLVKVKSADWERPYVGVEPNPACVHFLKAFIALNRIPGAQVIPAGLSDSARLGRFLSRDAAAFDTSASVVQGFRDAAFYGEEVAHVPLLRGEDVVAQAAGGPLAIIKIDVEGGELEVLSGLTAVIARDRPAILCEVLPTHDPASETGRFRKVRKARLAALLAELDYVILRNRKTAAGFEELESFPDDADLTLSDYLFLHRSDRGPPE